MKRLRIIAIIIVLVFLLALAVIRGGHQSQPKKVMKSNETYVALGDSVAAGDGLEQYSDSSACDRTNESYPNVVASRLNVKLVNISCSGATLAQGILGSQNVNDLQVTSQIQQLFKLPKPALISITIGANDIGWTNYIEKCYEGECGSPADTAAINQSLSSVSSNLSSVLLQIMDHYQLPLPHVVVTGYHQVFPLNPINCSDLSGINANELIWGRQQQAALNNTLEQVVAHFSYAKFATINFSGHELCTSDPWVQGLNDSAPYHPTDAGQIEFANQVIAANESYK